MIQNMMGASTSALHETSLYSRDENATIKDFKLKILMCFNSLITEHLNSFRRNTLYSSPILCWIEQVLDRPATCPSTELSLSRVVPVFEFNGQG
jgi:hypothetical protein